MNPIERILGRENQRHNSNRRKSKVELLEQAAIYRQTDQSHLDRLHQNKNDLLRNKTKKIRNTISNIGVSYLI